MSVLDAKAAKLRSVIGYIPWPDLEAFILDTSHIWRPVRGHCFETWFDKVMVAWGQKIISVGGDDVVDRILNSKTLQLKTVYVNGTTANKKVAYCLHKTHGKEKRPANLYKREHFADFLIGLHPNGGIIICPKESIPLQGDYPNRAWPDYLADPAYFGWDTEWLNRFDLLGIDKKFEDIPDFQDYKNNKLFPKIGQETKLTDEEIIDTLLAPENFRVLEQNMRGSIREWYFERFSEEQGLKLTDVSESKELRQRIKVDFLTEDGKRIQVKGITRSITKFPQLGVEVKGSHGRIPQRLYKVGDFDFLVVVLDPHLFSSSRQETLDEIHPRQGYNFVVVPANDIPIHQRSSEWGENYHKDIFKFNITDYPLNDLSKLE